MSLVSVIAPDAVHIIATFNKSQAGKINDLLTIGMEEEEAMHGGRIKASLMPCL
jgi:hypothetical protein